MNVSWSVPNDLTSFAPKRSGTEFVCEICPCGCTELFPVGDTIVAECDHLLTIIAQGEVIEIHSLGIRH